MAAMRPLLAHLVTYEQQARQQAEAKMAAQAAELNDFAERERSSSAASTPATPGARSCRS
jgi:hypothetical protein